MTRRIPFVAAVAALVLVAAPSLAHAEKALIVIGGGAVKSSERAALVAASKPAIDAAGWTVVDEPSADVVARVFQCIEESTASCLGAILVDTGADRAVVFRVTSEDKKDRDKLQVRGWVFRGTGELLAGSNQECSACRKERLREIVGEQTGSMVQRARARVRPATITVRSIPDGATIYIDGAAVGATEFSYTVYPGKHTIRLVREGYREAVRELSVTDGEKTSIDVKLHALDGSRSTGDGDTGDDAKDTNGDVIGDGGGVVAPPPPRKRSRLLPALTVGAGVAAVVGGVVVLRMDESRAPDGETVTERRETTVAGIAITGAGAVAVGLGAWWFFKSGRPADDPSPRPTAGVSRDGAWLGLEGRF